MPRFTSVEFVRLKKLDTYRIRHGMTWKSLFDAAGYKQQMASHYCLKDDLPLSLLEKLYSVLGYHLYYLFDTPGRDEAYLRECVEVFRSGGFYDTRLGMVQVKHSLLGARKMELSKALGMSSTATFAIFSKDDCNVSLLYHYADYYSLVFYEVPIAVQGFDSGNEVVLRASDFGDERLGVVSEMRVMAGIGSVRQLAVRSGMDYNAVSRFVRLDDIPLGKLRELSEGIGFRFFLFLDKDVLSSEDVVRLWHERRYVASLDCFRFAVAASGGPAVVAREMGLTDAAIRYWYRVDDCRLSNLYDFCLKFGWYLYYILVPVA